MTMQEMDRMNDSLQDRMLAAYERQQEREFEEIVNEEPPFDEEPYQFFPFDFRARMYPPFHNHKDAPMQ